MSQNGKSPQFTVPRSVAALGILVGRSLFPLVMVVILGGTLLWGPWVTMVLAFTWFFTISLIG
jgi:hypothetical protein